MRVFAVLAALLCAAASLAADRGPVRPTCTLMASSTAITSGGSSTLTWTTQGATSALLNSQARALSGSLAVSPTVTTTYTLVAVGKFVVRPCKITVAVSGDTLPQHSFWLGSDFDTTLSPGGSGSSSPGLMAQWVLDNVVDVTPTTKRPRYLTLSNANVERQTRTEVVAANMKNVIGLGGDWGLYPYPSGDNTALGVTAHPQYSTLVALGDSIVAGGNYTHVYVDEPFQTYGCLDLTTAPCRTRQVTVYNQAFAYLKTRQPDLKVGFCLNDRGTQLALLNSGLAADFVCIESYTSSDPIGTIWASIHAAYPSLEKVSLFSDTFTICQAFDFAPTGHPAYSLTVAYWNMNMYALWIAGVGLDLDFLANGQEYAATGQRQFCHNPRPIFADSPNAAQGADFPVNTFNSTSLAAGDTAVTLTPCEMRVVSYPVPGPDIWNSTFASNFFLPTVAATGVETLPWTAIPCAGANGSSVTNASGGAAAFPTLGTAITVTVGSGKMCRHNGLLSCHVYLRATNSLGRVGVRNFAHTINAPGLPGYSP